MALRFFLSLTIKLLWLTLGYFYLFYHLLFVGEIAINYLTSSFSLLARKEKRQAKRQAKRRSVSAACDKAATRPKANKRPPNWQHARQPVSLSGTLQAKNNAWPIVRIDGNDCGDRLFRTDCSEQTVLPALILLAAFGGIEVFGK